MRARIVQELSLLRQVYGEVEHTEEAGEDWFKLPRYDMPPGWRIGEQAVEKVPISFLIKGDYPGAMPYGFLAPANLNFNGVDPKNVDKPPKQPPFSGNWIHFSWTVENWAATSDVSKGSNLLAWCRGFVARFEEGA